MDYGISVSLLSLISRCFYLLLLFFALRVNKVRRAIQELQGFQAHRWLSKDNFLLQSRFYLRVESHFIDCFYFCIRMLIGWKILIQPGHSHPIRGKGETKCDWLFWEWVFHIDWISHLDLPSTGASWFTRSKRRSRGSWTTSTCQLRIPSAHWTPTGYQVLSWQLR